MNDIRAFFGGGGGQKSKSPKKPAGGQSKPMTGKRPRESKTAVSAAAFFGEPAAAPAERAQIAKASYPRAVSASSVPEPSKLLSMSEYGAGHASTDTAIPAAKKRRVEAGGSASKRTSASAGPPSTKAERKTAGPNTKKASAMVIDSSDDELEPEPAPPKPARSSPSRTNSGGILSKYTTTAGSPLRSDAKKSQASTSTSTSSRSKKKPKSTHRPGFAGERQGLEDSLGVTRAQVDAALAAFKKGDEVGHHAALDGDRFAFSGEHDLLGREELEELCKLNGGRVSHAVSGTTWALVAGAQLEDGRSVESGSKWSNAEVKDVAVWTAERFMQEILARAAALKEYESEKGGQAKAALKQRLKPASSSSSSSAASASGALSSSSSSRLSSAAQRADASQSLWADRFAPRSQDDLVGHATHFAKLRSWLQHWDERHLRSSGKNGSNPPVDKARPYEQPEKRAVLISGPPGIGKTTAAHLAAKVCGREIFELNASDTRSKKGLRERMGSVIGTQVLAWNGKSLDGSVRPHAGTGARRVIIMDEVDGLGASDRGGNGELIQIIKKTRTPIICLCNDRQKSSVRSLANNCFDLKFMRPQKGAIAKAMAPIAQKAGLQVDQVTLEQIAESCGNDMRQVLGMLQMQARTRSRLTYRDFSEEQRSISKDEALRHTAFSALPTVFSRSVTVRERYDAFFVDYDLLPLMVAQSYPSSILGERGNEGALSRLGRLAQAAESCSDGDIVSCKVRQRQQWQLLPSQAALNVRAGWYATGRVYAAFPDWLGRNSARNKRSRLLSELTVHMSGRVSGGLRAVRMDYAPAMLRLLLRPLGKEAIEEARAGIERGDITAEDVAAAAGGSASSGKKKSKAKKLQPATAAATLCAHRAIDNMDMYGLSREDVIETLPELGLGGAQSMWQSLDSKSKSAFTRAYNSRSHRSQGLHVSGKSAPAGASKRGKGAGLAFAKGKGKGKGKGKAAGAADDEDEDEDEDDGMDEGAALEAGMLGVE